MSCMLSERIDLARKPPRLRTSSPTATPGLGAERPVRVSCPIGRGAQDESSHGTPRGSGRHRRPRPTRTDEQGRRDADSAEQAEQRQVARVEGTTRNPRQGGSVTSRIETSRRHGPFDPRRPKRRLRTVSARPGPSAASLEDVRDGLDWDAFSSHFFPGRGRHDLEAVSAYDAYTQGRPWRKDSRPRSRRPSTGLEAQRNGGTPASGRALSRTGAA
jgi:hypothetical protein